MKRRLPRSIQYAQPGAHGRPVGEIVHRWTSQEKRRTHKREIREQQQDAR